MERLRRQNAKLKPRLTKTRMALDIMGKAHALLEELSESADELRSRRRSDGHRVRRVAGSADVDRGGVRVDRPVSRATHYRKAEAGRADARAAAAADPATAGAESRRDASRSWRC